MEAVKPDPQWSDAQSYNKFGSVLSTHTSSSEKWPRIWTHNHPLPGNSIKHSFFLKSHLSVNCCDCEKSNKTNLTNGFLKKKTTKKNPNWKWCVFYILGLERMVDWCAKFGQNPHKQRLLMAFLIFWQHDSMKFYMRKSAFQSGFLKCTHQPFNTISSCVAFKEKKKKAKVGTQQLFSCCFHTFLRSCPGNGIRSFFCSQKTKLL